MVNHFNALCVGEMKQWRPMNYTIHLLNYYKTQMDTNMKWVTKNQAGFLEQNLLFHLNVSW